MISRQFARQLPGRCVARSICTSRIVKAEKGPPGPTHESRTSPKSDSGPDHPGYTDASTPIAGQHPGDMPGPDSDAQPASEIPQASTRPHAPHPGIQDMAKGAEIGGQDSLKPEDRNVKGWGPNQRSAQFNPIEQKRKGGIKEGTSNAKDKGKK